MLASLLLGIEREEIRVEGGSFERTIDPSKWRLRENATVTLDAIPEPQDYRSCNHADIACGPSEVKVCCYRCSW